MTPSAQKGNFARVYTIIFLFNGARITMIESNKNYYISCLFFLFFFIGWGCCYPYLSLWLTETIGINYTDVGLVYSFTAIIAVCVQPLFGFISDKLVYRKNLMWMLAIIITLFAPYWIYVFAPLLKLMFFSGAGGRYLYWYGLRRWLRYLRSLH
jgi:OHS family lactose permease-like MFS transporter